MTRRFLPLRRIAGLSVAITLVTAPIASAQAPARASNSEGAAPANTALLSHAAFARLVQPPRADVAPPVAAGAARRGLLRQGTTAMAREAKAAFTKAPPQKSWASRHKVAAGVIIGVSAFFGAMAICWFVCEE